MQGYASRLWAQWESGTLLCRDRKSSIAAEYCLSLHCKCVSASLHTPFVHIRVCQILCRNISYIDTTSRLPEWRYLINNQETRNRMLDLASSRMRENQFLGSMHPLCWSMVKRGSRLWTGVGGVGLVLVLVYCIICDSLRSLQILQTSHMFHDSRSKIFVKIDYPIFDYLGFICIGWYCFVKQVNNWRNMSCWRRRRTEKERRTTSMEQSAETIQLSRTLWLWLMLSSDKTRERVQVV